MPKERRARNRSFLLRMNDEEAEKLATDADKAGMSRNLYMIYLLNGNEVVERVDNEFHDVARYMSSIATNMNQIAARANATNFIDVEALKKERENVLQMLAKLEEKYFG